MQEVMKPKKVLRDLDKIEVKKSELLVKCREHLAHHKKWLKEARSKWRKEAIQMMRHNITKLGSDDPSIYDCYGDRGLKSVGRAPQDQSRLFEEMIAKLEASNAEFVLLKQRAFNLYWEGEMERY